MMNRRSFFGAAAAAPIAASAFAAAPRFPDGGMVGGKLQTLSLAMDAAPVMEALEPLKYAVGISRSFDPAAFGRTGSGDRYVYRTGFPSIDALSSISGVHKARMEKRLLD
jgi:hypothetical protein